ncbi:MAG: glutamate synthase large subunit [Spirochaetes bacterium]|nr:glutamate synthase large subunit [Spirochaetota bacterium]
MEELFPENQGLYDRANEHDNCGIGFVADIKGRKSNDIVQRGLEVLARMEHRGAESADNKTGDGAGIMMQIPHKFFAEKIKDIPAEGEYGAGLVFLPRDKSDRDKVKAEFEKIVSAEGQKIIAWRDVPVIDSCIGEIAKRSEPKIEQVFISGAQKQDQNRLERKLYIIRKLSESTIRNSSINNKADFYLPSLSSKTIVYKGMLMPDQVKQYFPDLSEPSFESAMSLVHSRFSTNTFPSWDLAQPFRMLAHNGEINTVKGNRLWMSARESMLASEEFGDDIKKILPVIEPNKSDSASFDNALELLVMTGRSLPHALMMLIPESWNEKNPIDEKLKSFYEYHATFMEPWDGPASMVFCDGRFVGGTLDRNGLRPSRYIITKNGMIVMGSEVGVQDFSPEEIEYKGRLMPGKILLVDTVEGRIIPDGEVKDKISAQKPYAEWVAKNRTNLVDIKGEDVSPSLSGDKLSELEKVFSYNREDLDTLLPTMVETGMEPTSSMGTDTPVAVFSDKPQRLFNYFKQVFAQVTNPPIDSIREELVMTLTSFIGSHKNILEETEDHCKRIKFLNPLFSNSDVKKITDWKNSDYKTSVIDITYDAAGGEKALAAAFDKICADADKAIDSGSSVLILSDKNFSKDRAPIPSLAAIGAVHHHLVKNGRRLKAGLILETAEPREVHHFALLFAYGADAVNPYGALALIDSLVKNGKCKGVDKYKDAEKNFMKAINKAILKILSKMGTSTLRSYRGAQIFEAVGLGKELLDRCFAGTVSKIGGIGIAELAEEVKRVHSKAYAFPDALPESEGVYRYRKGGENHAWNPESIYLLQWATRSNDYKKFKEFSAKADALNQKPHVIRGMLEFKKTNAIDINEVEPIEEIMKRFTTGAMSFGSISANVHEAVAVAMNSIKGRSNSGEGGEDPKRFIPRADGTSARSAIKQVASGRFGVTSNYLANADEIQIKIAQGAKPGEGGQLPGHKVDAIIAKTRNSTPGVTLISPPPHHDIYSIEDLAQLIFDLKNANPNARISVKLVSESGVGTIAAGVSKAHADNILISGYDGGTGASPQSSIKHAGMPWEIGLAETHQTLVLNDLRGRVKLQTDGQMRTGRDIVIGGLLGAEEFGFGTTTLIVMGCIMMRKCHLNTCPVGIATQDPKLRKRFAGKPEHLINYFRFLAEEVREVMASLGIKKFDDLIGRTDLLEVKPNAHWKAKTADPKLLLHRPKEADKYATYCVQSQIHKIDSVLDRTLIEKSKNAIEKKEKVSFSLPVKNTDRTAGAMLSYEISKRYGEDGLPEGTLSVDFNGSAGQSFGAFLAKGVTFRLHGDANDYLGKGLSGGKIVVVPPKGSTFKPEENIIIGNTVLYGATSGEVYIRGVAGERFCVRNSGVTAVVEGTGDHCAEYMTGGYITVLGKVGRNFGAGMSGGIAYVYDVDGNFDFFCNKGMVELSKLDNDEDISRVKTMIQNHIDNTDSSYARGILADWTSSQAKFVKVMPVEYKRALAEMKMKEIDNKLKGIIEEEEIGGRA